MANVFERWWYRSLQLLMAEQLHRRGVQANGDLPKRPWADGRPTMESSAFNAIGGEVGRQSHRKAGNVESARDHGRRAHTGHVI